MIGPQRVGGSGEILRGPARSSRGHHYWRLGVVLTFLAALAALVAVAPGEGRAAGTAAVSVDAGPFLHTCGVKTDGTIACWGDNRFGQTDAPTGTFTSVSAGGQSVLTAHSCGLKPDGTIVCWGSNDFGQTDAPTGAFTSVSAGGLHSCGLKPDGTITCWGDNSEGQLNVPTGTFTSVSSGFEHSCGVKPEGTIACWGSNSSGQLGAAPAALSPDPPPGQVGSAYSHTFTSSTGTPAGSFAVSAGALPPGLSLSDAGLLSGTPTARGEYHFTVSASNGFFADATKEFTLNIVSDDTNPPTIEASAKNADGSTYTAGTWTNQSVTVSYTCSDGAGSGVASCPAEETLSGDGADQSASGTATDNVGNTDSATFSDIDIDQTEPSVTCDTASPGPTFVLSGAGGNVTATVTDDTSGPVSTSLSDAANVSSVGNKSVSLTGSDNAGNSTTVSCPYRVKYNFSGFLSPNPQSSYKAGSTIPVKFTLANASGTRISDATARALVASPCKVKVLFSGGTPTNNCATYNATTDTFQFNLKTSKSLASGPYTISVEVSAPDGSGVVNNEPVQVTIRR